MIPSLMSLASSSHKGARVQSSDSLLRSNLSPSPLSSPKELVPLKPEWKIPGQSQQAAAGSPWKQVFTDSCLLLLSALVEL